MEISFNDTTYVIEKPVEDWSHKDFLKYWDFKYKTCVHPVVPRRAPKDSIKLKAAITSSINKYGARTVRDMVDYAFENYQDFPTWNMTGPMLVFAAHYWSNFILLKVQKQGSVELNLDKKRFEDLLS